MKLTTFLFTLLLALGLAVPSIAQTDYRGAAERLADAGGLALEEDDGFAALKLYEQSLVAYPKYLRAYLGLAKTHFKLGNDVEGFKYFDTALLIDPTYLPALEGKAMAYLSRDNVDEARTAFAIIQRVCEISACEEVIRVTEALAAYDAEKAQEKS